MIVKPDCPVKLTAFQGQRILTQLKLGYYYKQVKGGAETLPPFASFVHEFDEIAKQFFLKTEYNFEDFVKDPHNATVFSDVLKTLFAGTTEGDVDYLTKLQDGMNSINDAKENLENKAEDAAKEKQNQVEEVKKGFIDQAKLASETGLSEFDKDTFENDKQLYKAMFHNTNYLEHKFRTFFVKDVIIKSLIIDTDKRLIVPVTGEEGELAVNKNLKDRRKEILTRLLENHNIKKVEDFSTDIETKEVTTRTIDLTAEDVINNPGYYDYMISELANRVTKPSFNNNPVDLLDGKVNSLYLIARAADNDNNIEAKKIVSDYMDFVALHRFDEVLRHSFNEYIYVPKSDSGIDPFNNELKYKFVITNKAEAPNKLYAEEIKGLETISNLYDLIMTSTPVLDINTGLPTNDYLSKPTIQKAFDKFFDRVHPLRTIESIRDLIIEGMHDNKSLWEDRNTLYTLYKNFYEQYEDDHFGNQYNSSNTIEQDALDNDIEPKSYLSTLIYNNREIGDPIMHVIASPLRTIAKVDYTETTVGRNGVTASRLSTTGKTSTKITVEAGLFSQINNKEKVISNMEKYQPTGGTTLDSSVEFTYNGDQYAIVGNDTYNGTGKTELPQELIHTLSKDLLGVDFDNSTVDKDFKKELISREESNLGSNFPAYYIQFLRQAFKVVVAKNQILTDKPTQMAIYAKNSALELATGNMLLNSIFTEGVAKVNLVRLPDYKVRFNRIDTLQPVLDAYSASKDRVTGNRAKSVLTNKEGNAISGYSKYNLFTSFKRNLNYAKELHESIINTNQQANVFSHNALIQDPNLFKGFTYRDAIEVNGRVIPNSKQTTLTTMHININGNYFSALQQSKSNDIIEVAIDPTVYSDKSKNALGRFGNDFNFAGTNYKLFLDDDGKVTREDQSVDLQYQTSGPYYKKYGQNIVDDWSKVIAAAGGELNLTSQSVGAKLKQINEFNTGNFWYSNKAHPFLRGRDAALYYADLAGVQLNNYVHYQATGDLLSDNSDGNSPLTIKDALIKEIGLYEHPDSSKLKAWLNENLIKDVNVIRKTKFKLIGDSAKFVEKQYGLPDGRYTKVVDKQNEIAIADTTVDKITSVEQILPAYRKYFYDWNFLSDNLLNIALGNIHAHKGKNANAAWTAMTKRNVMAGATIEPYILGLERGVEDFTNTAFVGDVITDITTIHGDKNSIVDLDGGAFVSYTQRLKTYESLNYQYSNDGGPEQKPFISMIDFLKGQNGMTKFADFVLDKETIRNSIGSDVDFMEMHKNHLYNLPISHINITESWKDGIDLQNLNIHVYRRNFDYANNTAGKIEKLERITHLQGNTYRILKSDPAKLNTSYIEDVQLNTWFDLWQALGDIDTVAPSKKKTSIYYTTENGANVYFDESDSSWRKLLDYEAYAGNKEHKTIKANFIKGTGESDIDSVYDLYKDLTGETDIVIPKLELMALVAGGDTDEESYNRLGLQHRMPFTTFVARVNQDADIVEEFFNHVFAEVQKPETAKLMKNWQPIKGKLIDRITTSGAQKFGQVNINRNTVYSKQAQAEYMQGIDADITAANPLNEITEEFINNLIAKGEIIEDCK